MKNGILILNAVLLVLVGVLFYLHFSSNDKKSSVKKSDTKTTQKATPDFKIAYFEMDSLESSFEMVKDVKTELGRKEESINGELERLERTYRNKAAQYQSQAQTMTQVQSEMATRDMMQLQQNMQSRKQQLDQEYQDFYMRKMKDVKTRIEDYLKQYNAQKGYTYIFAYEPGLFYYRDTTYNITGDVVKGLNDLYKKKK
ncbi:MAG TPA: OmpH family outer membrane protein [Chitinophagaceae bacterium]